MFACRLNRPAAVPAPEHVLLTVESAAPVLDLVAAESEPEPAPEPIVDLEPEPDPEPVPVVAAARNPSSGARGARGYPASELAK